MKCPDCGLRAFTVAYWLELERCTSCGAELPRPRRRADFRPEQVSIPKPEPIKPRDGV
ncbi:MAG: hypothetical protein QOD71_314 [Thermoleophilaceae bacterium]|nr:hypothetical protein [Thermoleophilaceae bacterium]